jgi:hypothetical protein
MIIPSYTIIDAFIKMNYERDDVIGDLCKDAQADPNFPIGKYLEQLEYFRQLGMAYPQLQDAVLMFYNELQNFRMF